MDGFGIGYEIRMEIIRGGKRFLGMRESNRIYGI